MDSVAGKIVGDCRVDVHEVLAVADCVVCVDTFVQVASLVALTVRYKAERLQHDAIE